MFALEGWLRPLYAMTPGVYQFIAFANLAYGAYSFSLALRSRRTLGQVQLLALANGAWAVSCTVLLVLLWDTAGPLGLVHVALEGVFVAWLAELEWKRRHQLLADTGTFGRT